MNKDCTFCKIILGEEGSFKLFEDDSMVAILDKFPINTGHILILPKIHIDTIEELEEDIFAKIMALAKRVVVALKKTFAIDGYTIMQNGGKFCDFGHFHLHIIPRFLGDEFSVGDSNLESFVNQKIANEIKQNI